MTLKGETTQLLCGLLSGLYSGNGLEMIGKVLVIQERKTAHLLWFLESLELYLTMVLKCRLLSDGTEERDFMVAVEVSHSRDLKVSGVNTSLVKSPRTGVFRSAELHLGGGLEMAGCLVVTLGGETGWSLLRSPRTELF